MKHVRLRDTTHPFFQQAWELYEQSFPLEERRPFTWQLDIMAHPSYHYELILQDEVFIGILLWWSFEEVRYIEHFATVPALRGQGHGRQILERFTARATQPVLLEVEPPQEAMQHRRIRFYEQCGFVLNDHSYQQPPYHKGHNPLPLLLMSYPTAYSAEAVTNFISTRHPLIYRLS